MLLSDRVGVLPMVGPVMERRLKRLEITTIEDLLLHIPHRYIDFKTINHIRELEPEDFVTVRGEVSATINRYTKTGKKMQMIRLEIEGGNIGAIWFNQPFLLRSIKKGDELALSGKVEWFGRDLALMSPEYEHVNKERAQIHTGRLLPVYPETAGVSSKWLRRKISDVNGVKFKEYLPPEVRKEFGLLELNSAVQKVHFPSNLPDTEEGRRRLAFDELLTLQMQNAVRRSEWRQNRPSFTLSVDKKVLKQFIDSLPFELTESQQRAIGEITQDLSGDTPMNRLLQGDVGSGKTVIAAASALVAFANGHQTIFMAPTQILAHQHYITLGRLFEYLKMRISLVTSERKINDPEKTDIVIGTHALLHKYEKQPRALVIIDEQHRFGVAQRAHLTKVIEGTGEAPHVLTMTATPIPRTVALTLYGDLDLSYLKEMPEGRLPVTTWLVPPEKRDGAYGWIRDQIKERGVQAFVICPLIEESDKETMKQVRAATTEADKLKKLIPELRVSLLHGRMKAIEKEETIENFRHGKSDVLVATPVVEVGIDIPNAAVIVIEAAERFGLAQLHQLRGRVGRGSQKSYCLLFTETSTNNVLERLTAMQMTRSGFELAEIDLKMRGPGEIFGIRQSGLPQLKRARWDDFQLIKDTKILVDEIYSKPDKYKIIINYFRKKQLATN